jgi:hypothetical protein
MCCCFSRFSADDLSHKLAQEIDGQRENDGRILLGRDGAQSLCGLKQTGKNESKFRPEVDGIKFKKEKNT